MSASDLHLTPIAAILTGLLGLLIFLLPRHLIPVPFLIGGIFLPMGLGIVVGPLHFYMIRVLLMLVWARLLFHRHEGPYLCTMDRVVLYYIIALLFAYTMLWQTVPAFINRLGLAFTSLGSYFFFRRTLTGCDDHQRIVETLAYSALVIALGNLIEYSTTRNLFSVLGGVSPISEVRDGRLRCQGPFSHSILAGTFGATLFPILLSSSSRHSSSLRFSGAAACAIIVATSASSGPILTWCAALLGYMLWALRQHMRLIRWCIALSLVVLHLSMNGPVWALIGKAAIFGSSSSDHRYELIDKCIHNVGEWWLFGTQSTAHWGWGMQDVSNHYVRTAIDGGLLGLALFFLIITLGFRTVGRALRASAAGVRYQKYVWGLGSALFAHLVAFFGVSYWDQSIFLWYLLLALIAGTTHTLTDDTHPGCRHLM